MVVLRVLFRVIAFLVIVLAGTTAAMLSGLFGASKRFRQGIYLWFRGALLWAFGVKMAIKGEPFQEAGIIMGNHRSHMDILFVYSNSFLVFLGKREMRSWPIFGWAARGMNSVFVDRSSKESRRAARKELVERIKAGLSPVVFPEGTCYASGLGEFHPGMFYSAAEMGVPILPWTLEFSDKRLAWVGNTKFIPHLLKILAMKPWTTYVTLGPPMRHEDGGELLNMVREWMLQHVDHGAA